MARNSCPPLTFALLLVVATCGMFATAAVMIGPGLPRIVSGLRLYKKVADANVGKNLLMSPATFSSAFRALYLGSGGSTRSQIYAAMRQVPHESRDYMYMMYFMYHGRALELEEGYSLLMSNRLYGPAGYTFKDAYQKRIRDDYGTKLEALDFKNDSTARRRIDGEVRYETKYKILELFPAGSFTNDTKLVLASAFAFRGTWLVGIFNGGIGNQPFRLSNGTEIMVPMMECGPNSGNLYANNTKLGVEVLQLYFTNYREAMYLLLPHRNQTLTAVENLLETTNEFEILGFLDRKYLKASIPKFTLEQTLDLKEPLKSAGIVDAFDVDKANFSRISDSGKLVLSKVMHKSYLQVMERGTDAKLYGYDSPCWNQGYDQRHVDFTLNRPFLFLVLDEFTRSVVLRGRMMNPLEVQ